MHLSSNLLVRWVRRTNLLALSFALITLLGMTGCDDDPREKVAKDWALTIRACQVIPVYPLTEDLQPGDVLLVSTPIEEQAAIYKEKGFLPLDQHLVRLDATGFQDDYKGFYSFRYGINGDSSALPPGFWQTGADNTWQPAPAAGKPAVLALELEMLRSNDGKYYVGEFDGTFPVSFNGKVTNGTKAVGGDTIADGTIHGTIRLGAKFTGTIKHLDESIAGAGITGTFGNSSSTVTFKPEGGAAIPEKRFKPEEKNDPGTVTGNYVGDFDGTLNCDLVGDFKGKVIVNTIDGNPASKPVPTTIEGDIHGRVTGNVTILVNDLGRNNKWDMAPRAAFPSYTFTVSEDAGLGLAIPIHGVPFALNLMNSHNATGMVTISDSSTYGLDIQTLYSKVSRWARDGRIKKFLSAYQPFRQNVVVLESGKYKVIHNMEQFHFLRVVSRVYVTGKVSVSIFNKDGTNVEAAGGANTSPLNLIRPNVSGSGPSYASTIGDINAIADQPYAGGRFKVSLASSRSVSLDETFDRPLVIGYIGFDIPILEDGELGAPISTLAQLGQASAIQPGANSVHGFDSIHTTVLIRILYKELLKLCDSSDNQTSVKAKKLRNQLNALAAQPKYPQSLEFPIKGHLLPCTLNVAFNKEDEAFLRLLAYLENAQQLTVERVLETPDATDLAQIVEQNNEAIRTATNVGRQLQQLLSGDEVVANFIDFVLYH